MAVSLKNIATILFVCSILVPFASARRHKDDHGRSKLHVGFYDIPCPQAEKIVEEVVAEAVSGDNTVPAGLIRLFFHDCFVNGCDASILLETTPSGEQTEKDSSANGRTLHGLEVIHKAKARIEEVCPSIVSCADILAYAARDSVMHAGLPYYSVVAGRRDGLISRATDIKGNLPSPNATVSEAFSIFEKKGMTLEEMVVLTGAHSIGVSHCSTIASRLHNNSASHGRVSAMDASYAGYLKSKCPAGMSPEDMSQAIVPFDRNNQFKLDNGYYQQLERREGLLHFDQAMVDDDGARPIVRRMAKQPKTWSTKFVKAMQHLGKIDVLTGIMGEIRYDCRAVNFESYNSLQWLKVPPAQT
ncbi:hem peroxidase [Dillenia turbinata]|uniref:Peroxidase n=1 Tax=Dillenia turbinata TaxID=194707 RepID=A0AAN8VKA1_9MAGN